MKERVSFVYKFIFFINRFLTNGRFLWHLGRARWRSGRRPQIGDARNKVVLLVAAACLPSEQDAVDQRVRDELDI
jgi:hypothetical protein